MNPQMPSRPSPLTRQRGFSLIEALTVLAIVCTISAAALPAFGKLMQRYRAYALVGQLTSDLALARMSAVAKGQTISVCPSDDQTHCTSDDDWAGGWIVFEDANRNRQIDGTDRVLSTHVASHSQISMQSSAGRTTTRYLPDGMASGANFTITTCIGTTPYALLVMNNAGRVRTDRTSAALRTAHCG